MGFLIIGREPDCHPDCNYFICQAFKGYDHCLLTDDYLGINAEYESEKCPLIEIPTPHGRLIDEDKVEGIDYIHGNLQMNCVPDLVTEVYAPTVIESEE